MAKNKLNEYLKLKNNREAAYSLLEPLREISLSLSQKTKDKQHIFTYDAELLNGRVAMLAWLFYFVVDGINRLI